MDYFKRAQAYADRADQLERSGCHSAAKRMHDKAQYWDKRGTRRLARIALAFRISTRHIDFMHRVMRKHRWRTWPRWKHSPEDRAFWQAMAQRERELQDMKASFKAAVMHARELLDE